MDFTAVPANILRRMRMLDISMKQMAASLGMSERNLYRRLKDPDTFLLGELSIICDVCKIKFNNLFREVY